MYEGEPKYTDYQRPAYRQSPPPQASYSARPTYARQRPFYAPTRPPVILTTRKPAIYAPVDYKPAPVSYPHNAVWNLVVPENEHHKITHLKEPKNVHDIAPPPGPEVFFGPNHDENENKISDPHFKTEAELAGKDFSGPFFYANTKSMARKGKSASKTHHLSSQKQPTNIHGHNRRRRIYYY